LAEIEKEKKPGSLAALAKVLRIPIEHLVKGGPGEAAASTVLASRSPVRLRAAASRRMAMKLNSGAAMRSAINLANWEKLQESDRGAG
jgi:hypothetical protein